MGSESRISFTSLQAPNTAQLEPLQNKAKFPKWGSLHRKVMHKMATPITFEENDRLQALLEQANTDYLQEPNSDRLFILGKNALCRPALLRPVKRVADSARSFVPGKPRQARKPAADHAEKELSHG